MKRRVKQEQKLKTTYPLHALQRTFLLSCSLVVFPLYRSSKDTLKYKTSFPVLAMNDDYKHVIFNSIGQRNKHLR